MDYRKHTKDRFNDRFIPMFKSKKYLNEWSEFTNDDYYNLCNICKETPLVSQPEKNRVLVKYKETYVWCVLSKKNRIIKTIYPPDKSERRKYL